MCLQGRRWEHLHNEGPVAVPSAWLCSGVPCRNDTTLQHGWLATPIARAAAEAAGVDAVVVELAAGHADGARGANGAAEARHDATLAQLVLVGDLAAEAATHERSADEADDTHHAVVRVGNTINGIAPTWQQKQKYVSRHWETSLKQPRVELM